MNFIRHCWNDFAVVIIVVVGFNWCFAFSLLLGELAFAVDSGLIFVLVVFSPPFIVIAIIGRGAGGSCCFLEYLALFIFGSPIAGWGWM